MLVWFLDDKGNMYDWAPKWADVEQVFLKQINVERFNKPESEWLNKFAKTTQGVVEGAQRIQSARKVWGQFVAYHDQRLILEDSDGIQTPATPAFEVTIEFLDEWLQTYVEALLVNDTVIRVRERGEPGELIRQYP